MEHLPKVRHKAQAGYELVIPFFESDILYGEETRGFQGFRDFPETYGYDLKKLKLGANSSVLESAFLQSWLFFGFLSESFGLPSMHFKHDDFIRRSSTGSAFLTTEALPKYVWYWQVMRRHGPLDDTLHHMQKVDLCLQLVNTVINSLAPQADASRTSSSQLWSPINALLLSIIAMAEYVNSARNMAIRDIRELHLRWTFPVVDRAMLNSGWCIGELQSLSEDCGPSIRYYLSTIDRSSLNRSHRKCSGSKVCQALQMDYSTYKTQHTRHCSKSSCKEVGISVEKAAALITNGQTPLVVVRDTPSSEMRALPSLFEYGQESDSVQYVAISHVWSDGMGNPRDNCLNECQLVHIQGLVNALYEPALWPVPFWMDTLCVPVHDRYRDIRQVAIGSMADIYRLADKVLVVDNSLQYCSSDISVVEMMIHIKYSSWMTRVWTLQEGRLSSSLMFQFLDKAVSSWSFHNTINLTGILPSVSNMLQQYSLAEVLESATLIHLAWALTAYTPNPSMLQYACMPPQEDPLEEDRRLTAIEIIKENQEQIKLHDLWKPILAASGLHEEPSDEDERLQLELRNTLVCPVIIHAVNTVHRIQGWSNSYALANNDGGDLSYAVQDLTPSRLFLETCSGFRARTTSRIEDETICLAILLRANLSEVQKIPTMNWRTKERLLRFSSKPLLTAFPRFLGLDARTRLQRCHEERMKVLLRQIKEFPISVIFWEAPRLRYDGWRWAPYSVMHRSISHDIRIRGRRGILTADGIEVQVSALKLNRLPNGNPNASRATKLGKNADNLTLVIHTEDDDNDNASVERQKWQSIRIRRIDQGFSPVAARSWDQYVVKGPIECLAILIQEDQGILVHEYGERDGVHLVRHIELVEKVGLEDGTGKSQAVHISGVWTSDDSWCIG